MREISSLLCKSCLNEYVEMISKDTSSNSDKKGKKVSMTVEEFHRKKCEEGDKIIKSLNEKEKKRCGLLISEILERADYYSKEACPENPIEQNMLYEIIISEAWKAATKYKKGIENLEKPIRICSFRTWVRRPWYRAKCDFFKKVRLWTDSMDEPINNDEGDKPTSLGDMYPDYSTDPENSSDNIVNLIHSLNEKKDIAIFIVALWNKDWPCPLCRHKVFDFFQKIGPIKTNQDEKYYISGRGVYTRRKIWKELAKK